MKQNDLKLVLATLVLIAAGTWAYSIHRVQAEQDANRPFALIAAKDQDDAEDFTLAMADGHSVKLSEALKKGPVVLDYWATWCGPCREEMPKLEALSEVYHKRGVQFYGVNIDAKPKQVAAYARKYGLSFPQIVGVGTGVDEMYQVGAYPTTLVINRQSKVCARNEGSDQNLTQDLSKTLDAVLRG